MLFNIFVFLNGIYFGYSFNIHINDTIELKPNTQDNNSILFGHSIALTNEAAIIGAPQSKIHGNLYKCMFSLKQCYEVDGMFIIIESKFCIYVFSNIYVF